MAILAPPLAADAQSLTTDSLPRRRFTVDEYALLGEIGILHEDDRIELIGGELIEMAAMAGPHIDCVGTLNRLLVERAGRSVRVHSQLPVRLPTDSEPEPDFSLVRPGYDRRAAPLPADVLLVIEVSDSSLRYDREIKLPLYAAAGIPEAWIFDLNASRIERHSDPGPEGYRQVTDAGRSEALVSTVLPSLALSIDDVVD